METSIKNEELVNNSNQPQTITEKVVRDLKQHISKVNDLIEKVTENGSWDYHQFSDREKQFEDFVNVDEGVTPQQIKNWLDFEDYDFEGQVREEMEEKWNDNWVEIVEDHIRDYDSGDFYFIGEGWVDSMVDDELDDYIENTIERNLSKGKL